MLRIAMFFAFSAGALAAFVGLSQAQPPAKLNPDTAALAKGNDAFAFDLYRHLGKEPSGNLFFSPYSISNALAMTYAGARGQTATDMMATMRFPFEGQRLHPAFTDLIKELARQGAQRKYQLSIANRIWGQKDYGFLPEFLKLTDQAYGAGLQELDFVKETEQARQIINAWVEKETQDRIKDLLAKGILTPDTRMVLTNAIYFKAQWAETFNAKSTKKEDFKVSAQKSVPVEMMQNRLSCKLLATDAFQFVELPYRDHELSMLVLLPRKADGLADLEKQLTADNLQTWLDKMSQHRVTLSLPKFKYTSEFKLKEPLSEMGMAAAFGPSANFSGMTTREGLFIQQVVHKAFVAVDEYGTEAAAATAVVVGRLSLEKEATFRADHPFVFLIRDNRTGSVLFLGRVVNP